MMAYVKVEEQGDKRWPLEQNSVAHGRARHTLSICCRIKVASKQGEYIKGNQSINQK